MNECCEVYFLSKHTFSPAGALCLLLVNQIRELQLQKIMRFDRNRRVGVGNGVQILLNFFFSYYR